MPESTGSADETSEVPARGTDLSDVPVLRGEFIAPSGGRFRWWSLVDCMAPGGCGGQHLHADRRRPGERGWLRCCVVTGVPYRVVV